MADKLNNYSIGDNNIDSVMLTLDRAFQNSDKINITGLTDTVLPQVAAGSVIEINGAYFKVTTDETISGSLTIGTSFGYIAATPSGATASFSFTHVAPTFSYTKNGFYGAGALSNSKYLPFIIIRTASSVYEKRYSNFAQYEIIQVPNLTAGNITAGDITLSGNYVGSINNDLYTENVVPTTKKINCSAILAGSNHPGIINNGVTTDFYVYKPISVYYKSNNFAGSSGISQYYDSTHFLTIASLSYTNEEKIFQLNPGRYRIFHEIGGDRITLLCIGAYGTNGGTPADIWSLTND